MNLYNIISISISLLILDISAFAQNQNTKMSYDIFVFGSRYEDSLKQKLRNDEFRFAQLFTTGSITESDDVDTSRVRRSIERLYPNANDSGICVIDWEALHYKNMRKLNGADSSFIIAEQQFLLCIQIMKESRPNLKIGIYGIPYFKYKLDIKEEGFQINDKFKTLLSHCDFIAPTLYIPYPAEQIGKNRNLNFIQNNLEAALELGFVLGKPVIPFVWHRVHPSNKKFSLMPIPPSEFDDYIKLMVNTRHNGQKIDGLFWWEYSKSSQQKYLAKQNNLDNSSLILLYKEILKKYR